MTHIICENGWMLVATCVYRHLNQASAPWYGANHVRGEWDACFVTTILMVTIGGGSTVLSAIIKDIPWELSYRLILCDMFIIRLISRSRQRRTPWGVSLIVITYQNGISMFASSFSIIHQDYYCSAIVMCFSFVKYSKCCLNSEEYSNQLN